MFIAPYSLTSHSSGRVMCYAYHEFQHNSKIVVPSKRKIRQRYVEYELKHHDNNKKKLKRHIEDESRELKRMFEDSSSDFTNAIGDNETFFHATTIPFEDMERSEEDISEGVLFIKPAVSLSEETKDKLPRNSKDTGDVHATLRALHTIRMIQERSRKPFSDIMLYDLGTDKSNFTTTCLSRQGHFRTNGQDGKYKISTKVQVKRAFRLTSGAMGNICDPDSKIILTLDNGDANTQLSVDMKRNVKNTERYNKGLFRLNHDDDDDDMSIGAEKTLFGQEVEELQELPDPVFDKVLANILEETKCIGNGEYFELRFANLSTYTQRRVQYEKGRRKMKKAFRTAEDGWAGNEVRIWSKDESWEFKSILTSIGYSSDSNNDHDIEEIDTSLVCFTKYINQCQV